MLEQFGVDIKTAESEKIRIKRLDILEELTNFSGVNGFMLYRSLYNPLKLKQIDH